MTLYCRGFRRRVGVHRARALGLIERSLVLLVESSSIGRADGYPRPEEARQEFEEALWPRCLSLERLDNEVGAPELLRKTCLSRCWYLMGSRTAPAGPRAVSFFVLGNRPFARRPLGGDSDLLTLIESEVSRLVWRESTSGAKGERYDWPVVGVSRAPCAQACEFFDSPSGLRSAFGALGLRLEGRVLVDFLDWPMLLTRIPDRSLRDALRRIDSGC